MAGADGFEEWLPASGALERLAKGLGPLAVIAVEAASSEEEGVVEVGVVRLDHGSVPKTFHALCDPGRRLPTALSERTGLRDEDVRGRPSWGDAGRSLRDRVRGATLVAFDAPRAAGLLRNQVSPTATWLDLLELGCVLRPELPGHGLEELARSAGLRSGARRPMAQVASSLALLARFHEEIESGEHDALVDFLPEVERDFGWSPLFAPEAADDLGPLGRAARRGRRPSAAAPKPAAEPAAAPRRREVESIGELLSDERRLGEVISGYRVREGQIEFTEAILRAFREDKALAIEAGTGIGKTLGYGLAAFLHALDTGERVIVSSANRTLQERVVAEELPAIARALGVPPLPAVVLKGRANYGNPRRARDLAQRGEDAAGEELGAVARLYLLSYFTRCPHRDLLGFGAELAIRQPGLAAARERIACSGDCDIRACRSEPGGACGYLSRVDALSGAAVVSINHSLLLSWPARYGNIERLVIDEAHELVGEGDRAFSEALQARELRGALRRVRTHPKRGLVGVLATRIGRTDLLDSIDDSLEAVELAIDEVGSRLVAAIGEQESAVPPATLLPPTGPWVDLSVAVERLASFVSDLASQIEEVAPSSDGRDEDEGDDPRADAIHREAVGLGRFFRNAAGGILGDVFSQSREDHVYAARGYQKRDGGYEWSLQVTPLDAAELIHASVLEPARTVVALSATLGVGGDPSPTLDKLGWGALPREKRMDPLVLPSPFDFERHAVLGLVRGSTYRDDRFEDDCAHAAASVGRLLGGRTLALFTSRRRLYQVARRLQEEMEDDDIRLLVQPSAGGAAPLVEEFLANPRSILLGTRSLWQGVDIPGDALSCVLIDKFPFPQPNDPLLRGRQERLRSAGEDAFRALSLEPAVVLFKQMFGRLVRSETDRGFVVVLGADPSKSYVREFVSSLPGPPRVLVDDFASILNEMREFFGTPALEAAASGGTGRRT